MVSKARNGVFVVIKIRIGHGPIPERHAIATPPVNLTVHPERPLVAPKKVVLGVATGVVIVASTVLTAYLVKKYGAKNISDIGNTASAGKEILQDILRTTPVSTTQVSYITTSKVDPKQGLEKAIKSTPITSAPVSQVSTPKARPKQVLETAAKSISTTSAPASRISAPRVSVSKPSSSVPPPYSFESLMRQNDDLLKKMLAELA